MAGAKQNGLYGKIVELLESDPKVLWTYPDVAEHFEVTEQAATNGLYNMHRGGKICRHRDKDPETNYHRYAFKITDAKNDPYIKSERGQNASTKKKKGQLPSAREMRTAFAQLQNSLANMEDMMIAVVEESEHMEKMLNKIKNITN